MDRLYAVIENKLNISQEVFDRIIADEGACKDICECLFYCLDNKEIGWFAAAVLQYILDFKNHEDGGPGSGNFGHSGRPGEVGGSAPSGSGPMPKLKGVKSTATPEQRKNAQSKLDSIRSQFFASEAKVAAYLKEHKPSKPGYDPTTAIEGERTRYRLQKEMEVALDELPEGTLVAVGTIVYSKNENGEWKAHDPSGYIRETYAASSGILASDLVIDMPEDAPESITGRFIESADEISQVRDYTRASNETYASYADLLNNGERKDIVKKAKKDPEFRELVDGIVLYTEGGYKEQRKTAELLAEKGLDGASAKTVSEYVNGNLYKFRSLWKRQLETSESTIAGGMIALNGAINESDPTPIQLFRVAQDRRIIFTNGEDPYVPPSVGDKIKMTAPTSFTASREVEREISKQKMGDTIHYVLEPGAKAVYVAPLSKHKQKEYLSCGEYEVVSVTTRKQAYPIMGEPTQAQIKRGVKESEYGLKYCDAYDVTVVIRQTGTVSYGSRDDEDVEYLDCSGHFDDRMVIDGGPGSGNFGHKGRVGEVGGSVSNGPFDSSKCNVNFGFGDELPKNDVDRALSLCGANVLSPGKDDNVRVRKGPDGVTRAQIETDDAYAKVFIRDERKELYLDELFLKDKGTGKGTSVVNEMVRQAESNGLETIRLIGGGVKGDSMNGYYTFARLGFDAELPKKTQNLAAESGIKATRLSDLMETQDGRDFWKKNGYAIEMTFDVHDGSKSRIALESYIQSRNDGGPGSGNHGHKGVPGQVGGSAPSEGGIKSASSASGKRNVGSLMSKASRSPDYQKADTKRKAAAEKIIALEKELRDIPSKLPRSKWTDDQKELVDLLGEAYAPSNPEWHEKYKERDAALDELQNANKELNGILLKEEPPVHLRDLGSPRSATTDEYVGFKANDTGTSLNKDGSRIVEMSPEEYLKRCAGMFNDVDGRKTNLTMQVRGLDRETIDKLKDLIRSGEKLDTPWLDERGINGQEGRHRAAAAYELGIEKIPVVYWDGFGRNHNDREDGADTHNSAAVLVIKDGKILVGTRLGDTGNGQICGPGGHVQDDESVATAAIRETEEEFGIVLNELVFLDRGPVDDYTGNRPYIFLSTDYDGEPKCDEEEMSGAKFLSIEEIIHGDYDLFDPFRESLFILLKKLAEKSIDTSNDDGTMNQQTSLDADENGDWITVKGTHVFVGEKGSVQKGPAPLKSKKFGEAKSQKSSSGQESSRTGAGSSSAPKATHVHLVTPPSKKFKSDFMAARETQPEDKRWRVSADYEEGDYDHMSRFQTSGGSTFAIHDGDIVSVCKHAGDSIRGKQLMAEAVAKGGNKLDSFSGNHGFYVRCGFEPVSWCAFDEQYAPDGWDKNRDKKEPVIFYKYTGNTDGSTNVDDFLKSVPASADYDSAKKARDDSM